jgi:tetratricopeptide (TPR) repeat protein
MTCRTSKALTAALVVLPTAALAAPPARVWPEEHELQLMEAKSPHAFELMKQGDAKAAAGSFEEAEALFRQAHDEYADAAILSRRDCEMLIELGRRRDAVLVCSTALGQLHTGTNFRALVSAYIDGPTPPTPGDLGMAVQLTATERHYGLSLAVAAAACDIAERIGDIVMLQRCAEDLQRFDASDPSTKKAQRLLDSRCPPWRFWIGWSAIAAAIAATLGHAALRLFHGRRSRSTRAGVMAATAVALVIASMPAVARAAETQAPAPAASGGHWLSRWPIDDEHPDSKIPTEKERNAEPLQFGYWLQDLALKAEHASKRGDHLAAARFYEVLCKAVPDRAVGFGRACNEYEAAGELEKATNFCAEALLRDGLIVKDYTHFINLVLSKPGRLGEKETTALANVLAHMREDPEGRPFVDELECQIGARTSNVAQLKECTAALVARAPDDIKTITYQWTLAVADGQIREAETLLERARTAGVPAKDIESMKAATSGSAMRRALRVALIVCAVALLATALLVGFKLSAARKRISADPAVAKS